MRKFCIFFLFLFSTMVAALAGVHRVGTYNIRYPANDDTGEKAWSNRRATVVKMLKDTMNYDVVALQEVYNSGYYNYLTSNMTNYTFYTIPDVYGVAVAYRTSKYKCLGKGYFKLVPSPKPAGWEALQTRRAIWVKLQDKSSGEIFYFASTHLDLYPISIREGARICAEKMREIAGDYACIITGDMNSEPGDRDPHGYYKQYFGNARELTKTAPKGSYYTFSSSMDPGATEKRRLLDYVYVRNVEVESYWANNSTLGRTLFPSDHIPVRCEITILPKLRPTTHVVTNVDELREAAATVQTDDIIYLCDGVYDLGDSTLKIANTCVFESSENAILMGATQLLMGNDMISLELRGITIQDATCPSDIIQGSLVYCNGNYLKLTDCTIRGCSTMGAGLIYAEDCEVTIDHCLFQDNVAENEEGGVSIHHGLSACSYLFKMTNTTFRNNTAFYAPAVYYTSRHTAYLSGNSFVGNRSQKQGCVFIEALSNSTDIRLVNNTFINNSIRVESSFYDYYVGGTAIWQEMNSAGCLTLVNNTIVGNHTACWVEPSVSSEDFWGGAVQSLSGRMKVYNNIIAGNYSSCPGRGDISMDNPDQAVGGANNVFSCIENTNYSVSIADFLAPSFAEACQSLVSLFGGEIVDGLYVAPLQTYGEQNMLALSPLNSLYSGENIAVLDAEAMSATTMESDILNKGSVKGTLTTDQIGTTRNTNSVPGAMEVGQIPTSLHATRYTLHPAPYTKILINNQLYIIKDNVRYNAQGVQL